MDRLMSKVKTWKCKYGCCRPREECTYGHRNRGPQIRRRARAREKDAWRRNLRWIGSSSQVRGLTCDD